jgi:hypothetical protein
MAIDQQLVYRTVSKSFVLFCSFVLTGLFLSKLTAGYFPPFCLETPPYGVSDHYGNPLAIAYYYGSGEQQLLLCEGYFYGKVEHQQPPW